MTEKPWESEPDFADGEIWGYRYYIARGPMGHFCGYVEVREGHPAFGKDYDGLEGNCHGGLTWAHDRRPGWEPTGSWWFGFDCARSGDFLPKADWNQKGAVYRDLDYVKRECYDLIKALAGL